MMMMMMAMMNRLLLSSKITGTSTTRTLQSRCLHSITCPVGIKTDLLRASSLFSIYQEEITRIYAHDGSSNKINNIRRRYLHDDTIETATRTETTTIVAPIIMKRKPKNITTSLDSKWEDMTKKMLDLPVGSFKNGTWNETEEILEYWFSSSSSSSNNNNKDTTSNYDGNNKKTTKRNNAVEMCWLILDRLYLELKEVEGADDENENNNNAAATTKEKKEVDDYGSINRPPPRLSTMDVLNQILLLWRDDFLDYNNTHFESTKATTTDCRHRRFPSLISLQLQKYENLNLITMDAATHGIILDTAGKYSLSLSSSSSSSSSNSRFDHPRKKQQQQQIDYYDHDNDNNGDNDNDKHDDSDGSDDPHNQGVIFADRYLRQWIDDYIQYIQLSFDQDHQQQDHDQDQQQQQRRRKKIIPIVRPDIVALGTVVHAWVESGLPNAPIRAEKWLKNWEHFEQQLQVILKEREVEANKMDANTTTIIIESKRRLYTSVLLAWARAGNPIKAREWIDRMIKEGEPPDIIAWNCLLMSYQSSTDTIAGAERAEGVLRHMQKLYHEKNQNGDGSRLLEVPPNVHSYNIVIDLWTKRAADSSGSGGSNINKRKEKDAMVNAAQRAHDWLEQMKKVDGVHPNTITYNTVITAYSRAGYPQRSEELLNEMITNTQGNNYDTQNQLLQQHQHQHYNLGVSSNNKNNNSSMTTTVTTKPDVQSFTSILAGWARIGTIEAAERADELLQMMQRPEINIEPNVETYGSCIHCWARVAAGTATMSPRNSNNNNNYNNNNNRNQEKAVKRAEELFHEMRVDRKIQPNVFSYTGLLNAYGRSGRAEKAHEFLEACLHEYDTTGNPRMKPTAVTFTAILNAWSKVATSIPDAADKAHSLLRRMKEEYGIEPNAFSYSTVLDAYARSNRPDATDKAHLLFHDMREVVGLEPNAYTCTNVLKALARGGRVEVAEELLIELINDERVTVKLGPHAFSCVLHGWSKSKRRDAAERAEDLLIRMQNFYRQKKVFEPPNAMCYNNVLTCWAHSNVPGAAERADLLLRTIIQQQEQQQEQLQAPGKNNPQDRYSIRCNRIMYNTVMNAWANHGNLSRVNELYTELVEKSRLDRSLNPDEWTYRAVWKAILKTNQVGMEERHQRLQMVLQSMNDIGIQPTTKMKLDLQQLQLHQQINSTNNKQ
jgi:pentatricopeptide repeat protein